MRQQTRQERWAAMSLPQRQKEFRLTARVMTVCLAVLLGLNIYSVRNYGAWSRLARQYHATQADARDVRLPVISQDEYAHSKGPDDYVLGLQEPGGKVRHVDIISHDLWQRVNVGDTVTAQIWHDRVRQVQAKGMTSLTSANPDYQLRKARHSIIVLGGTWLLLAGMSLWNLSRLKRQITQVPFPSTERIL